MTVQTNVKERFLKYVSFYTTSDEESETVPSAEREKALAEYLKDELTALGLSDVCMDQYGYVYAVLPESEGCNASPMGLIAHMDTSPDAGGENVRPREVVFDGSAIDLGNGAVLSPDSFPSLLKYEGESLIVTDGSTLLGADDKAGVAEIVSAMSYLIQNPQVRHGRIYIAFTPDEEIGRGADYFDRNRFRAEYAYTVDGGALGEIEYENFNAASAKVTIHGVNIHPGEAKGKMKNAVLIAAELIEAFPPEETPAQTEGYEGFYHISRVQGNETEAVIQMIIRDHDFVKFTEKKENVLRICARINEKYGADTATAEVKDSYYNMKEKITPVLYIVEDAMKAMEDSGVTPMIVPIRGGTDGARLSYEGLPCPNLSTGGENFHSIYEYIPARSLEKMVEVIVHLCQR